MTNRRILFTDGEGPIVTNDFAYELMAGITIRGRGKRISGKELFTLISKYDDRLAEQKFPGYEAGNTLALIIPFFLYHGVTDAHLRKKAQRAKLANGVKEYVAKLKEDGWHIRIISTAYTHLWDSIGTHLGIHPDHIASTGIDLARLRKLFHLKILRRSIENLQKDLVLMSPPMIHHRLHHFFWKELVDRGLHPIRMITVIGGKQKILAAEKFAKELGVSLRRVVYVGDSITDAELFSAVARAGGLTIAVNGNRYALEKAHTAVATLDMRTLYPLLSIWATGRHDAVASFIKNKRNHMGAHYAYVDVNNRPAFARLVAKHARMRTMVRADAAALG